MACLPDPPSQAQLPDWRLDCNPECTSAHAYSFLFWRNGMGLSLEWSYFERTITRTITSLAGDGRRGTAAKAGETLSRRVWVLNVRTAGNLGRARFCLLSSISQFQRVTDLTCHDHWLFCDSDCSEHASRGGQQCFRTRSKGDISPPSKPPGVQGAKRKVMLSCAQRHVPTNSNNSNKHISLLSIFHYATKEMVESEGQGDPLTLCVTSQTGSLLLARSYRNASGTPVSWISLFLLRESLWRTSAIFVSGVLVSCMHVAC